MAGENVLVVREQGGAVLRCKDGGSIVIETNGLLDVGGAGARKVAPNPPGAVAGSGIAVEEQIFVFNRTKFTLTNWVQTLTDTGANGAHGGIKIYDFPEGLLLINGVVASATVVAGAGGVADGAVVLQALGTAVAATDNATLVGTGEGNILASNSTTLSSGAGTWGTQATGLVLNSGVNTPTDMYLNTVVADADVSAGDEIVYNGTIWVVWGIIGDR